MSPEAERAKFKGPFGIEVDLGGPAVRRLALPMLFILALASAAAGAYAALGKPAAIQQELKAHGERLGKMENSMTSVDTKLADLKNTQDKMLTALLAGRGRAADLASSPVVP